MSQFFVGGGGGGGGTITGTVAQYQTVVGVTPTSIASVATGTAGQVLTSNGVAADPSYQTPAGGGGLTETIFTANGTWTADASTKWVDMFILAGGGGGGGGASDASSSSNGGGGGGGGIMVRVHGPIAAFTSPASVVIGAGGAGGTGGDDDGGGGNDGTDGGVGGTSSVGTFTTANSLSPSTAGKKGLNFGTGGAGGRCYYIDYANGYSVTALANGGAGDGGDATAVKAWYCPSGGGGGVYFVSGASGSYVNQNSSQTYLAGAAGVADSNGNPGNAGATAMFPGTGGSGGSGSGTFGHAGYNGGVGSFGAGGGGGGPGDAATGQDGGNGGAGGAGKVWIYEYA